MRQAFLLEEASGKMGFVGNRTECALLLLLKSWGVSYEALREETSSSLVRVRAGGRGSGTMQTRHERARCLGRTTQHLLR